MPANVGQVNFIRTQICGMVNLGLTQSGRRFKQGVTRSEMGYLIHLLDRKKLGSFCTVYERNSEDGQPS